MELEPTGSEAPWVIDSKFEPSRPNIDLVPRDRLTQALDSAVTKKLALVQAPAGYGKSTLLGEWFRNASRSEIRCAWLTLDVADSDANQFLSYVVLALARSGVEVSELETGARNGFSETPSELTVAKLVQCLQRARHQTVLILDDYHQVESPKVDEIVKILLRDATRFFSIFINSREPSAIGAPALIAAGSAIELGPDQLRLTEEETLGVLADTVGEADSREIYIQTEGWPVAVQLARVQKKARPTAPILAGASGGLVASYLTEQVLSSLDDDVRDFLLTVSYLERFNPDIANYIRSADDSWQIIDRLSPLTALFVPLEEDGDWCRLHHLFAEYLRELLVKNDPSKPNKVLMDASKWHAEQDAIIEAVKYAAEAKNYEECKRLVLDAGGWKLILTDGIGILRSLFRLLPDNEVQSSPRLMIARAYLHCKYGEIPDARALIEASGQLNLNATSEAYERDRMIVESMINLYEDRESWTGEYVELRRKYPLDQMLDPLEAGTVKCEELLISLSLAQFSEASETLRSAFGLMRQSGSVLGLNYCYLHAAHIAIHRGEFDMAAANVDRALKMAEENFGSDSGLKNLALVLEYSLKVWRGNANSDDIPQFRNALFHTVEYDGWTEFYLMGLDAAVMLAEQCGNIDFADEVLDRFLLLAKRRGLGRLERFSAIYRQSIARQYRRENDPAHSVPNLLDWAKLNGPDQSARYWQCYLLTGIVLKNDSSNEVSDTETLRDQAIAYAEKIGAGLYQIRLTIAKVLTLKEAGDNELASDELVKAVKLAAAHRVMGPFLSSPSIRRVLREVRADLRQNEEELIALNFVNTVLARSDLLRPNPPGDLLSVREQEILEQLANGLSNKEIARGLELTDNTVKFHLKSIYLKLSVNRRTQAISKAKELGLIE